MSEWLSQVEETLRRRGLFPDGQPILVAVSGGLDSMVLLRVLEVLAPGHGWRLAVAHFNHQLRGRSSDADERFVSRAARALGLRCVVGRADVRRLARAGGLSVEMAARQARHDFLARAARRLGARTVALAHHADDQVELFFLRLLRGCGGEGLAGMRWRSPSPSDPGVALARPFLDQPKAALRRWAKSGKIRFHLDESNARLDIPRNRIRRQLLPLLERHYQPALRRTVLRLMDIVGEEADLAAGAARDWLGGGSPTGAGEGAAKAFADLPVAVQRRCLQLQLVGLGVEADYDLVEQLRAAHGRPVSVRAAPPAQAGRSGKLPPAPAAWGDGPAAPKPQVERRRLHSARMTEGPRVLPPGRLVFRDAEGRVRFWAAAPAGFRPETLRQSLSERAGEAFFEGVRLRWRVTGRGGRRRLGQAGREYFDADGVGTPIVLRHWRPGDRFQPSGLAGPAKVQDLLTNAKVPRARRHELLVAATARGELFWVEGLRIAERFKLREGTKRCLQWAWKRL